MGMFDELLCLAPLPDGWDPAGEVFQTKDTPEQYLTRYVLRADGALIHEASGERVEHHGPLEFYTSNWCGSGPWGDMTRDDQPLWTAEYTAYFHYGTLLRIQGGKRPDTSTRPQMTRREWRRQQQAWHAARAQEET